MSRVNYVFDPGVRPQLAISGSAGALFAVCRIYCIGRNDLAHIREMGEADERDPPIFFQKPVDSIVEEGLPSVEGIATFRATIGPHIADGEH